MSTRHIFLIALLTGFSLNNFAQQTGINTKNPQGALHVDAAHNNPATGAPTAEQTDDFIIDEITGNVGIGTVSPSTKLHIVSSTPGALTIADGAHDENHVLLSDAAGNGKWVDHPMMRPNIRGSATATNVYSDGNTATPYRYTGFSITLTEGDWIVNTGLTFVELGRKRDVSPNVSINVAFWQRAYLSSTTSNTSISQTNFSHLGPAGNNTCYGGPMYGLSSRGVYEIGYITGSSVIRVPTGTKATIYLMIENKPNWYYRYNSTYWENYFYAIPITQ